jgi:hypothetical protein
MRTTVETERYEQLRDDKASGLSSTAKGAHKLHVRVPLHKRVLAGGHVSALGRPSSPAASTPNYEEEFQRGIYLAMRLAY